ncbi:MAG: glycosyltransferase family 39 protein, partial [Candidatus Krumholzibacteriota bacterium]|nr:glycosyltransferase family 39 protein [Candidatus Krumholzibacteriota bacterium]
MRKNKSPSLIYDLLAGIVILMALYLRARGIAWGLPMVLEEATPMREAYEIWIEILRGNIDLNPHFFNYPSFTIYLQMLLQYLGFLAQYFFGPGYNLHAYVWLHQLDPSTFLLIGRASSLIFSVGGIYLMYLIMKKILEPAAGLLTVTLLALVSFHIVESRLVQTDLSLSFFTTLCVFLALKLTERRDLRGYIYFGIALGLATASKYNGLFALVSLLPAHFYVTGLENKKWSARLLDRRLLAAGAAAALIFLLTSPYCLLDFSSFWKDLSFERGHMQMGHFTVAENQGNGFLFYWQKVLLPGFGYLMALFSLGGIIFIWSPPGLRGGRAGRAGTGRRPGGL